MNKEKNKSLVIGMINLCFILVLELIFMHVWELGLNVLQVNPFEHKGNWLIASVYVAEIFVFLRVYGGLKIGHLTKGEVILSQFLAFFIGNMVMLVLIILVVGDMYYLMTITKWMSVLMMVDVILSFLWVILFDAFLKKIYPAKSILMVYEEYSPEPMIKKFRQRKDKYNIKETISVEDESLQKKILEYNCVVLYDVSAEKRNDLMKFCYVNNIEVYMTSKVSDTFIRSAGNVLLFDSPLLHMTNNDMNIVKRIYKRLFDLMICILMLLIASPVMVVVAILIKAYDGGSAIYKQERCTLNGKRFMIYKFRSMKVNAEEDGEARLASKIDDRITPVGEFIRKTRLDELPQLLNVLKGEMSIVGPRPERPEFIEKYEQTIPEFSCRLKVKGGLTGYAQIYGKYSTTPYDKLKMDLMYIQNYSLWLDIKLILMTIKVMFIKESAEGILE